MKLLASSYTQAPDYYEGNPGEDHYATHRRVEVFALDSGKFELKYAEHREKNHTPVQVSSYMPEAIPLRWRAKTLSELVPLSASSFSAITGAQVRSTVYDAEDALKKDLDL